MLETAPQNNNEGSQEEEMVSQIPENLENSSESLEDKINSLEHNQDQIQELTENLGGPEGVSETVNSLSSREQERLQTRIKEKQRSIGWTQGLLDNPLDKYGEGEAGNKFARWVDTMYGLSEDKTLSKTEKLLVTPIGLAAGGIFKPGVDLGRKLKIGFEKFKLKRMEKKLEKNQS